MFCERMEELKACIGIKATFEESAFEMKYNQNMIFLILEPTKSNLVIQILFYQNKKVDKYII